MRNARLGLRFAVFAAMGVGMASAVATVGRAADEDENPHLWKPRTRSVAVFKNGLGFFMREGEVKLRQGWCVAEHVPPATFGTLAIYSLDEKEKVDIVGSGPGEVVEFDGRDAEDNEETRRTRLAASMNLKIQLNYEQKDQDRTAAGQLVSVGPEFAVLDTGTNSIAVPVDGITRMQILDLPLRVHINSEAEKPAETSTVGMAYLRKGITWIPDYTLRVLDDETAELTLRGTVVNEAEDLIHTDVHLVVGVPHFVHTDYMAPIAVGQVIRSMGAVVAAQSMPSVVQSQLMMNNAAIVSNGNTSPQFDMPGGVVNRPVGAGGGDLGAATGNLPQMSGSAATDYTVYTKKDLTLRRGEKAIVTLFTQKITYSHIYRWTPPGKMEHSLVLHNNTDTAWTTGPCLAVSAERPLSEDLLRYTPKGTNGELPVTAAINIAHGKVERELERKLKAHSVHTTYFDLVTLEGELNLHNFEKRDVDILVNNPVPGKPLEADQKGSISSDSTKLKLHERQGSVSWHVKLKPGESVKIKYQYERYVHSM
ncbi:MAG: hypothetical protein HQ581_01635 [Planctomycetes bacterium]|nr:hypothetical protein [Planctomycetota bacterium]